MQEFDDAAKMCPGCKRATKKRKNAKGWLDCGQECGYSICPRCAEMDAPLEALAEHEYECGVDGDA
jgi:hypothetical protein